MKRILLLAVLAVFVMMPLSSFAKTAISESEMAALTAQEGVTIDMNHFNVDDIQIAVQGWGDNDGFSGYGSAGWVGASISTKPGVAGGHFLSLSGNITIDVGTNVGVTAVKMGLPGIVIDGSVEQVVALGTSNSNLAANLAAGTGQILGRSYMAGITLTTSGYMVISAH